MREAVDHRTQGDETAQPFTVTAAFIANTGMFLYFVSVPECSRRQDEEHDPDPAALATVVGSGEAGD